MTAIIILGLLGVGYWAFMKFYYPKFKQQFEENEKVVQEEWLQKKDEIISEYLTNSNKFGLISDIAKDEKVLGIMSAKIPDGFKSKLFSGIKDAVTFTKSVDMAHYYLVATDKGLHYTGFDGEKCFINEVFDYNYVTNKQTTKNALTFNYKDEKLKFNLDNDNIYGISGYPRFAIHERSKAATSNDRTVNYFVREYFAIEPTENAHFKQSNQAVSFNMDALKVSPEKTIDLKVREHFVKGFKQKLGIG